MSSLTRKTVLIAATASFAAMVTGVSRELHLSNQEHQHEHDSDECSVCRHFLNTPEKFTQEPEPELSGASLLRANTEFPVHICITAFHHSPFSPRGPPAA